MEVVNNTINHVNNLPKIKKIILIISSLFYYLISNFSELINIKKLVHIPFTELLIHKKSPDLYKSRLLYIHF